MKIVCDACGKKYQVADEKVRGKVFKIRCKQCGHMIMVKGDGEAASASAPSAPAPETPVPSDADPNANPDAVWHLVVGEEQVGPLSDGEILERIQQGLLDADTYIWRDGFQDWERIADVEPFSQGFAAPSPRIAEAATGAVSSQYNAPMAAPMSSSYDGDAGFGMPASVSSSEHRSPKQSGGVEQLKGQRSENSVLFSLNNLVQLANESPTKSTTSPPPSSAGSSSSNSGGGPTEGSGLIDIRSMSSLYLGEQKLKAESAGSVDDLPMFATSSFEAASPVLMPRGGGSNNNKLLIILASSVAALVVAVAVILIVVLGKDDKPSPATVAVNQTPTSGAKTEAADPATAKAVTPPSEQAPAPTQPPEEVKPAAGGASDGKPVANEKSNDSKPDKRDSKRDDKPKASTSTPAKVESAPPPAKEEACDEVACLVEPDKACCKKYRKTSSSSSSSGGGSSDLPESPSKGDINDGISKVKGRAISCGDKTGGSGTVMVKIRVSPSGSVDSVSPSGGTAALRDCVAQAVENARFRKSQKGITVNYPFVFK